MQCLTKNIVGTLATGHCKEVGRLIGGRLIEVRL